MERPKAIFHPWDEIAFTSSVYSRHLNCLQRWAYRSLLLEAFSGAFRPYVPADDNQLWVLAGCESSQQWVSIKDPVLKRFVPHTEDGVQLWKDPDLEALFRDFTSGFIYFVQGNLTKRIKIGFTDRDPKIRLMQLQVGSPDPLTLLGCVYGNRQVEGYLHNTWRNVRVHGEWFDSSPELLQWIKGHKICRPES